MNSKLHIKTYILKSKINWKIQVEKASEVLDQGTSEGNSTWNRKSNYLFICDEKLY